MTEIHRDGPETVIMAQFGMKHYRHVRPVVSYKVGDSADKVARDLVTLGLEMFNLRWPGAHKADMVIAGVSDFLTIVNADGSKRPHTPNYHP